jgi:hypothetical protein
MPRRFEARCLGSAAPPVSPPPSDLLRLAVLTALALLLHLALGWAWALLAPVALGVVWPQGAVWRGSLGYALSWTLLSLFYALTSGVYFERAAATIGQLIGGVPAAALALALVFALLAGLCAGLVGQSARRLLAPLESAPT